MRQRIFVLLSLLCLVVVSCRCSFSVLQVPPGLFGFGLFFNGQIDKNGFGAAMDRARVAVEDTYGRDRVLTDYVPGFEGFDVGDNASLLCIELVTEFYRKGYRLLTAPGGFSACLVWAHENLGNDLYILRLGESSGVDLSLNPFSQYARLSTAFVRIWEARYSSGIIAGAFTHSGSICFPVAFSNRLAQRDAFALHLGAKSVRPDVKTYYITAGGFDNATLAKVATELMITKYDCDVVVSRLGQPAPNLAAARYNRTSLVTDYDGRLTIGESILSSVVFSWDRVFLQTVGSLLNNSWTKFAYEGGFGDDSLKMTAFGNSYRLNETAKRIVDHMLPWYYEEVKAGRHNGFCNVTAYGLQHAPGTNCLAESDMKFWKYGLIPEIIDLGAAQIDVTDVYITWADAAAVVFVIITVTLIFTILVLVGLTAYHFTYNHPAFRRGSPQFLFLVCLGSLIMCVAVFFIGGSRPSQVTCNIALWFVAVGLNISHSAIVTKAGRLWYILRKARQAQSVQMPNKRLLALIIAQLLVVFIILILGTSTNSYRVQSRTDPRLPEFNVYVYCIAESDSKWAFALVGYQGFLSFVGLFFALKTRHIYDELNESREIAIITYNLLFVGAVFVALISVLETTPLVIYSLECAAVLWLAAITAAVSYFPKVYHLISGVPLYSEGRPPSSSRLSTSVPDPHDLSALSDVQASIHPTSALSDDSSL